MNHMTMNFVNFRSDFGQSGLTSSGAWGTLSPARTTFRAR